MGGSSRESGNTATPVFGLTKAQLRPVVEEIAGEPVDCFDIAIEREVEGQYGYQADKVIPTFMYTTASGRCLDGRVDWTEDRDEVHRQLSILLGQLR